MKRLGSVPMRVAIVLTVVATATSGQGATPPNPSLLKATFGKLPVYFIENKGLYPDEVSHYVQGADKTLFFTGEGVTFRLKGKDRCWAVKLVFVGANQEVVPRGEDKQKAVFSYFKGPEKDWKTGLRTYRNVVYENLWPGIDLVCKGTVNQLKYEFVVKPGADPDRIRLRYRGATSVALTDAGALRVNAAEGGFEDAPPVAWQDVHGKRATVEMAYALDEDGGSGGTFGFRVGEYDRSRPLVLDPAVLVYCGYIGGSGEDFGYGIAVDAAGNAYVTGTTTSTQQTFPVTVGPDPTFNGGGTVAPRDTFVAKVDPQGTALVYCGYIGGGGDEIGSGIAVDAAGNAYVTGWTSSDEKTFPVRAGPDLTYNGGTYLGDAFVAKVNPQGTALAYCGYLGGAADDQGYGIAVDAAGSAYVTGTTSSTEQTFPVAVGPDLIFNGGTSPNPLDAFVAKVNPQGTALVYCGYVGGSAGDCGRGIAVDASGNAYISGATNSTETTFPVRVGPDLTYNGTPTLGGGDAFVAKVNTGGTALVYCGYVGGSGDECGFGIAVDTAGGAYVTGYTTSNQQSFPVKVGPVLTYVGGAFGDAFVAKVNTQGTALVYCGYIGGGGDEFGYGVAVDAAGSAYVAGSTSSTEATFPVKVGPDQSFNGGAPWGDVFLAKVNTGGTALVFCGYIGGSGNDRAFGIALDTAGNAHVTGFTESNQTSFPVTAGPDPTFNGGNFDALVAKVSLLDDLTASGAPRPGGTVTLHLAAVEVRGLPYVIGSSHGSGPIRIDRRQLDLSPDYLLFATVNNDWPWIFSGYRGVIDSKGQASAAIHIPNVPGLIGVRLYSAFVTLDPAAASGIRSISNTFLFSVTK